MPTLLEPPATRKPEFRVPRIPDHRDLAPKSSPPPPGGAGVPPVSQAASNPPRPTAPKPVPEHSADPNPGLPPSESLLSDYLMLSAPLPVLARRHKITLAELADRIEAPEFQTLLKRLSRLAAQRARHTAVQVRSESLSYLSTMIATSDDPELIRKCATPILRASDRELYPQRSRKRPTKPSSETTPKQPPTANAPYPDSTSAPPRPPVAGSESAEPCARTLSPCSHPCCPSSGSH